MADVWYLTPLMSHTTDILVTADVMCPLCWTPIYLSIVTSEGACSGSLNAEVFITSRMDHLCRGSSIFPTSGLFDWQEAA